MCYACSPECDNCFAKLLECPACGHIEMLSRSECSCCGQSFAEELRQRAREEWAAGRRFSRRRPTRNLAMERLAAKGKMPSEPAF